MKRQGPSRYVASRRGQRLNFETRGGKRSARGAHHVSAKVPDLEREPARQSVPAFGVVESGNSLNSRFAYVLSNEEGTIESGRAC